MRKLAFFLVLALLLCLAPPAQSQKKIKYKDIWGLLNTKQYEAAEPFLKAYLKENDDNPNAFLYMGIIQQEKASRGDVLKETATVLSVMDSSIQSYTKAYQTITEKEIKRNDEYYQSYNRRDLRTGEFGIKLSDVQFDLEKRMEGLRERIDRIKMVKYYFLLSDTLYKKSAALFASIQQEFVEEKELFLRADSALVADLGALAVRFDSCTKAFEQYKGSVQMLGKIGYNQVLSRKEIKTFKVDGYAPVDFYTDEVAVWDYKTWAVSTRNAIEKEIFPIREHLISYDIEINKLRERMVSDSTSVKNDLTKLIDRLLLEKLAKYDPRPFPMDVFAVKIADLEYRSALIENTKSADSSDVRLRLTKAQKELDLVSRLDSLAGEVLTHDFDKELRNYHHFVTNTYGNSTVLRSFLKVMKDFSSREKQLKMERVLNAETAMKWMVADQNDSIPLFEVSAPSRFMPLSIVDEKFTVGLLYKDSVSVDGYFCTITPSRVPDIKITFPVNKSAFKRSLFPATKTLAYSDASGQVFYVLVFSETANPEKKYPATLAKIYRSDGLAWSSDYSLGFIPSELTYKPDSGEFIIRADASESVVDKNGKMLR